MGVSDWIEPNSLFHSRVWLQSFNATERHAIMHALNYGRGVARIVHKRAEHCLSVLKLIDLARPPAMFLTLYLIVSLFVVDIIFLL